MDDILYKILFQYLLSMMRTGYLTVITMQSVKKVTKILTVTSYYNGKPVNKNKKLKSNVKVCD